MIEFIHFKLCMYSSSVRFTAICLLFCLYYVVLLCICFLLQSPGNLDECIPIGDFSFDPDKIVCCSLESGNILSHGSVGKGYGLATTGITSGCFIWKVKINLLTDQ